MYVVHGRAEDYIVMVGDSLRAVLVNSDKRKRSVSAGRWISSPSRLNQKDFLDA